MDEWLSVKERRLLHILRDPNLGAYFSTKDTGEHYLLSSGRHTEELYQVVKACRFRYVRGLFSEIIIEKIRLSNLKDSIEVLIGVAIGALPLLYELQQDPLLIHTEGIWVEKEHDPRRTKTLKERRSKRFKREINPARPEFVLGRNFRIDPSRRAVIVDDVYSTGGTLQAVIDACNDYNVEGEVRGEEDSFTEANIIGALLGINRAPKTAKPLHILMPALSVISALSDPVDYYPPELCPACKRGVPLRHL